MSSAIDEFYIIRADLPNPSPDGDAARSGFVGADGLLESFHQARKFASVDQAEACIADLDAPGYRFLIQLCSREVRDPDPAGALERLLARVMEIAPPYRRTAYNWLRGKDVESLLRRQGEEVHQRHVAVLADHGLDITRPSPVVLMRPRPRRRPINTGAERQGPRQYLAPSAQRPSAAPLLGDGDEDD